MKHYIEIPDLPEAVELPVVSALAELDIGLLRNAPVTVRLVTGDRLSVSGTRDDITLTYSRRCELFRALSFLPDFIENGTAVSESRGDGMLCYMADMSRNAVCNTGTAEKIIRLLALCGYDSFMLYTEDTFELPEYPYFGYMRGRFTLDELKKLDMYAYSFGIELIPCVQTLAHLGSALRWGAFSEIRDTQDILLVGEEKTYRFIDAILRTCRECFRSNRINIGLDEAHMLGLGTYLRKNGYHSKPEILLGHLNRVVSMCKEYGYSPMMWSDMFFRMQFDGVYRVGEGEIPESVKKLVPPEVTLIYWDYYTSDRKFFTHMVDCHGKFNNPVAFAGGLSKWYGFAPLNALSIELLRIQLEVCAEHGINDIIMTSWGNDGAEASQLSVLPSLLYCAEKLYCRSEPDINRLERRCRSCFGTGYQELLLADLPNNVGMNYFNEHTVINPCTYLLYNDPLTGLMDLNSDTRTVAAAYRENAAKLKPMVAHERYGYMFETLYLLCDMLAGKSDLSARIRRAYTGRDRETLGYIATAEIPELVSKLDAFTVAFRRQWYRENQTFGFDIQEERLGGLRLRMLSAADRITGWLSGSYGSIEELERGQLRFCPGISPENPYCRQIVHSEYVSVNKTEH